MDGNRIIASVSLTVGSFLFSASIAVVLALAIGAQSEITAISPAIWMIVNPIGLLALLGGVAIVFWILTIYSWISIAASDT